jgi:radical SAM superfamily enzyme YgiQ (UPF0313 family)
MKVLAIDPEFPRSFWSLRESAKLMGNKALMPPLGLLTLAALLPQEWEFRLADLNVGPLTEASWQWADLVMITGMLIQREGILRLVREAKARGKTVIVGGPFASSLPQEVLAAGTDFVVRGEGETTIPHLLAALREGQPGGMIEEDGKPPMTISPVPRFDLINFDDYALMAVQTCRGCPFDCEFCDIVSLYGRTPRGKDPGQVIAELETLYRLGWRGLVFISDDNFIGNKDHARAILNRLIPWIQDRGEPFGFWTQASVNLGQDRELIDLLTAANFGYVFLGVETPEPDILRAAGKYQNVRNSLKDSLAAINANGLNMIASFIIGFDGERRGAVDHIEEFVEELAIPVIVLNIMQPLPNTRLWKRLEKEDRLLQGTTSGDFYGLGFNYLPTRPQEEILGEFVRGIDRLYEPSRFLARVYRFFLRMRPTRRTLARQAGKNLPGSPQTSRRPASAQSPLQALVPLLRLLWRQGIRPTYRWQFWKQLWAIYRQNPSRLEIYLMCCSLGEDLFAFRRDILKKWHAGRAA